MAEHKYPLGSGDQHAVVQKVEQWRTTLGLGDWHLLSIEFVKEAEFVARCITNDEARCYRIEVRMDWDVPVTSQNIDYIVVHELLHVVLNDLWRVGQRHCPPGLDDTLEKIEHQAIARIVHALAPPAREILGVGEIARIIRHGSASGVMGERGKPGPIGDPRIVPEFRGVAPDRAWVDEGAAVTRSTRYEDTDDGSRCTLQDVSRDADTWFSRERDHDAT